jgi:AcrR family transcriptional regulator
VSVKKARPTRRERAEQTRRRIIKAAYRLFCDAGYEDTTMQQVANAAGVAVQTVYFVFGTKAKLLAEVESFVILGDDPSDRWREQPWAAELRQESDPRRLIARFVEIDTEIKGRITPFVVAVGSALPRDDRANASRDEGRDQFFRSVIDRLVVLGALRPGLDPERALEVVIAVDSIEAHTELTWRRGWTAEEWCNWLTQLLCRELLGQ